MFGPGKGRRCVAAHIPKRIEQFNCREEQGAARVVAATVAGNALEFFDFTTYAFFAVYIGQTFFPLTSRWSR